MSVARKPLPRPDSGLSVFSKGDEAGNVPASDTEDRESQHGSQEVFKSATSPWMAFLLFVVCFLMHAVLVAIHLALVIIRFKLHNDTIKVSDSNFLELTGALFYDVTLSPNTIIKVCCFVAKGYLS